MIKTRRGKTKRKRREKQDGVSEEEEIRLREMR